MKIIRTQMLYMCRCAYPLEKEDKRKRSSEQAQLLGAFLLFRSARVVHCFSNIVYRSF